MTNGGYIDNNTADGLRLTLAREFHHIYIYNLRGNRRAAGEQSRREGGQIFGAGSRATVAIMLLIKEPTLVPTTGAEIHYRDIGDYLTRDEKLATLARSITGATPDLDAMNWDQISPNKHGDWTNQRTDAFAEHLPAHDAGGQSIFELRTNGLQTNRDAWNYNSSRPTLEANTARMINHYNAQVDAFYAAHSELSGKLATRATVAKRFVDLDQSKFSWDREDFKQVARGAAAR